MTITPDEITSVLGPVDPTVAAQIAAYAESRDDLAEAWARVNGEKARTGPQEAPPSSHVGKLVEILSPSQAAKP